MKIHSWDTNLKIRLVGESLFFLLYWMYFPFIAVYFSKALGNHMAGLLMTLPPIINIIGSMVGGYLTDRVGRRPVMLIGTSVRTVMFALFAMPGSYWIQYLAFIGVGLGGALYSPANDAMIADLVPQKDRKQVYATFMTTNNIGAVLGPAIGAFFFFHYRTELLWTCSIVMLIYSLMIFLKTRETMPNQHISSPRLTGIGAAVKEQWKGYGSILRDKVFILYILGGVFSTIAIMQLDLYLAIYVTEFVPSQPLFTWGDWSNMLSSTEVLGWVLGLNGLLFVLFIMPVTKWLKNWKDRNVFILSSILAGVGMFLVGLTTNIWILFVLTIIFTFGEIVRAPVATNFVSDYAPENARGQYMGASSLQYTFGRFLAPVTVFLSAWVPSMGVFSLILISAILSGVFYIKLYKMDVKRAN
ncbi:MDR family MFS transporter [Neobacillus sp. D3-1R]|uniref:MDR family MFS transporter n=1 Tax=Neobacillus sp. D3-1R TaxID=3445778 RepID=UPI003F9F9748